MLVLLIRHSKHLLKYRAQISSHAIGIRCPYQGFIMKVVVSRGGKKWGCAYLFKGAKLAKVISDVVFRDGIAEISQEES